MGILGGFVVGVGYLDISVTAFAHQMIDALGPKDLITGVVKSVAFAWGIGLIGLFYGFRVHGGAAEVGRTTTASVVASIFYIIVADCAFSILFYVLI
jgi:phospholipid/cholesterol/gamma-HCH transport system permease protein